jgi:hypothetical protein
MRLGYIMWVRIVGLGIWIRLNLTSIATPQKTNQQIDVVKKNVRTIPARYILHTVRETQLLHPHHKSPAFHYSTYVPLFAVP